MNYRVLLLVLALCPLVNSLVSLSDVGDVISFSHEVIVGILRTWKVLGPLVHSDGPEYIDLPLLKDKEKKLLTNINVISRKVDQVDRLVRSATSASMLNLKQDIPSQVRVELRIDTLLELVSIINFADETFKEYTMLDNSSTSVQLERHTLESFASHVVSHSPTSVQGVLDRLHGMISPDPHQGHTFLNIGVLQLILNVLQVQFPIKVPECE